MFDQTIEELPGGGGVLVYPIIVQFVAEAKPHMMRVKIQEAAVGDGRTPDVAGDIGQKIALVRIAMFLYVPKKSWLIVDSSNCFSQVRA